jgi:hypothetical protein
MTLIPTWRSLRADGGVIRSPSRLTFECLVARAIAAVLTNPQRFLLWKAGCTPIRNRRQESAAREPFTIDNCRTSHESTKGCWVSEPERMIWP